MQAVVLCLRMAKVFCAWRNEGHGEIACFPGQVPCRRIYIPKNLEIAAKTKMHAAN